MQRVFAVIRSRGLGWDEARSLEEQAGWPAHAAFMDALQAEGLVVLGGPLAGTPDVLLIMRAHDEDQITSCLAEDPWSRSEILEFKAMAAWTLRLGSIDPP